MFKVNVFKIAVTFLMFVFIMLMCSTTVFCTDLDTINSTQGSETDSGDTDEAYDSISDIMRGYNAVDDESMQKANQLASPIADLIGVLIGFVMTLTVAAIFFTTSLDLAYIGVPFMRTYLYPGGAQQSGGVAGMPGAFGANRGMVMGSQGGSSKKFVSDEAIQAVQLATQDSSSSAGGVGMPGGYGGVGVQQPTQQSGGKSAISIYMKKRIFFIIVFAIASTILMSSLLLDCGLNLADLLYKIISLFSNEISNVQI